jgi:hypothetical protein
LAGTFLSFCPYILTDFNLNFKLENHRQGFSAGKIKANLVNWSLFLSEKAIIALNILIINNLLPKKI